MPASLETPEWPRAHLREHSTGLSPSLARSVGVRREVKVDITCSFSEKGGSVILLCYSPKESTPPPHCIKKLEYIIGLPKLWESLKLIVWRLLTQ